jgi:hypothetical protein
VKLPFVQRLRKVISGGQTGADRTALECAQKLGLETGGTVPKGCRTDEGQDDTLVTRFGCIESSSAAYPPRTEANVRASDATVWFGHTSTAGGRLTRRYCEKHDRPFLVNPTPEQFRAIARLFEIINVAGNRKRKNPDVVRLVRAAFNALRE